MGIKDPLQNFLSLEDLDWEWSNDEKEILMFLQSQQDARLARNQQFEELDRGNGSKPNPSIEEPFTLELNPLSSNLKYVFLNPHASLLVVIATGLNKIKEENFVESLERQQ